MNTEDKELDFEDDGLEEIKMDSVEDEYADEPEEKKAGFHISFHLIFAIVSLALIALMIIYVLRWNARSVEVDTSDIAPDQFDIENLDYYVYPDQAILDSREDDGVNNILIIGNHLVTHEENGISILSSLESRLPDANFYSIVADCGKVASDRPVEEGPASVYDSFSLIRIVNGIISKDINTQIRDAQAYPESVFSTNEEERSTDFCITLSTIDLNQIDTVIIMYAFDDYYNLVPTLLIDNEATNCYYGALYNSVKALQENYPHLSIVISSPVPIYFPNEDGSITPANLKNFGFGNSSAYIDLLYYVATKFCVSYIDNYNYGIVDENITEYVNGSFNLTEKGIKLISKHMADFLNEKPAGNVMNLEIDD